jgi:hypothetical protein
MKTTTWKEHAISLLIGAAGAFTLMVTNPLGSTDPAQFGFYWSLFTGMFVSFSTASIVRRLQKKPKK